MNWFLPYPAKHLPLVLLIFGLSLTGGPLVGQNQLQFPSVYFDTDKDQPISSSPLDSVTNYLKQHPTAKVTLEGHADHRASDSYNKSLSERRARNVAQLLEKRGIDKGRITQNGKGESQAGKEKGKLSADRRVAITVTGATPVVRKKVASPENKPENLIDLSKADPADLAPPELSELADQTQGEITIQSQNITMKVIDWSEVDGDIVTLMINGVVVASKMTVTGLDQIIRIEQLPPGDNWLRVIAIDQGYVGAASPRITIDDGFSEQIFTIRSYLGHPGAYLIRVPETKEEK